jgi:hypothetical protein
MSRHWCADASPLFHPVLDPHVKDLYIREEWEDTWAEEALDKFRIEVGSFRIRHMYPWNNLACHQFDKYKSQYDMKRAHLTAAIPTVEVSNTYASGYGNAQRIHAVTARRLKEALESMAHKELDGYITDPLAPEANFNMLKWWSVSPTQSLALH